MKIHEKPIKIKAALDENSLEKSYEVTGVEYVQMI